MLKVGLTGSIAVGKSHVLAIFAELGCKTLDADRTARDVVGSGSKGLNLVVDAFGSEILTKKKELNRKKLGQMVFSDASKRQLLNSILHPLIIEAQEEWMMRAEAEDPDSIAIIDAALMIESGSYQRFEEIVVVWCRGEIQLERLMSRDRINQKEAERKIQSQLPQTEKKKFGSFLIDTSDEFGATRIQTEKVFEALKTKLDAKGY